MAYYLLDTDAIIDYLAGIGGSVALIRELNNRGEFLCVCDVVIAEVYAGLRPQDRDKARTLLTACFFLPAAPEAAQRAGEWRYHYAWRGITLSTADVLVAATAFAHKAAIVTGNTGPVKEYIADLEANERAKLRFDLALLEAFGLETGAPHVRSIKAKLWELRIAGRSQHQILYFATYGRFLVLVHAFTKKTPKTPPGEIETAMRRMADYLERTGR